MSHITVRLDEETREMLDEYCSDNGLMMSNALRKILRESLEDHKRKTELGFKGSIGEDGLMISEKRMMTASVESLLILRKIAKHLSKNDESLNDKSLSEMNESAMEMTKNGFTYN